MDAVGNRLDKLKEDAHLRRIFSHVPEQNDAGEYVDNRFDFREFLDEDATIIFDLGDLRPEAQRAITLLLLSNLWDAVRAPARRPDRLREAHEPHHRGGRTGGVDEARLRAAPAAGPVVRPEYGASVMQFPNRCGTGTSGPTTRC